MGADQPTSASAQGPAVGLLSQAAGVTAGALLFGALCVIAVGIMLLVWPKVSLTVIAILIGAAVLVSGLVKLWEGFTASDRSGGMRVGYVVVGLLAVLAGVYLLRHHTLSIYLIAFVTGVYFIVHGITDLGLAMAAAIPGRGLRAGLGVVSIAAGLIMVVWPGPSLVILYTLVAAWLLFYGCMLGALAFGVRRAAKSAAQAGPSVAYAAGL